MKCILSRNEMQRIDERTQEKFCVPSLVLMERAALAVSEETEDLSEKRYPGKTKKDIHIVSVCGSGNNGGDGLACARILFTKGYRCTVLFVGNKDHMTVSSRAQMDAVNAYHIPVTTDVSCLQTADVIIDAVFGIGLNRPLSQSYIDLFHLINAAKAPVVSVDIPSGVDADTGLLFGAAVFCEKTVTFNFSKIGHIFYPGAKYTGKLIIRDVGITAHSMDESDHPVRCFEKTDLCLLPKRDPFGHKGTFGKVLVIAGSKDICGAAILAGKASLHAGAGMVMILTHENNRDAIYSSFPEAMVAVYNDTTEESQLKDMIEQKIKWCDTVVCGPGLGMSQQSKITVEAAVETEKPMVLDADALNLMAAYGIDPKTDKGVRIATPHVLEMARLLDTDAKVILSDRIRAAKQLYEKTGMITVLKDARTVTVTNNKDVFINLSGNEGMGTAGSGDVLAGIIGSLLVQKMEAKLAAPFGVYLHGYLGDLAKERITSRAMTAMSLIDMFPYLEGENQ